MTIKELAFKVEELRYKAAVISSMESALFSAIYMGAYEPQAYEWAMVDFGQKTSELSEELEALEDELFASLKQKEAMILPVWQKAKGQI